MARRLMRPGARLRWKKPAPRLITPEERELMERLGREITQPAPRFFTREELEKMAKTEGAYQYRGDAK